MIFKDKNSVVVSTGGWFVCESYGLLYERVPCNQSCGVGNSRQSSCSFAACVCIFSSGTNADKRFRASRIKSILSESGSAGLSYCGSRYRGNYCYSPAPLVEVCRTDNP